MTTSSSPPPGARREQRAGQGAPAQRHHRRCRRGDVQPGGAEARAGQQLRRGRHPRAGRPAGAVRPRQGAHAVDGAVLRHLRDRRGRAGPHRRRSSGCSTSDPQTHAPPVLLFAIGRFRFQCVLVDAGQRFTMFLARRHPGALHVSVRLQEYVRVDRRDPARALLRISRRPRRLAERGHRCGSAALPATRCTSRRAATRSAGSPAPTWATRRVAGHRARQRHRRPVRPRSRARR